MAMTNAERQKRYRDTRKKAGLKRDWIKKPGSNKVDAGDLAKMEFEKRIAEMLKGQDDRAVFNFYNDLYKKAKTLKLETCYGSLEYQAVREMAREHNKKIDMEN